MSKRITVWGAGVVGKLVIAEIMKSPGTEPSGVGVSLGDLEGLAAMQALDEMG